jgi:aldose 1-epimerase
MKIKLFILISLITAMACKNAPSETQSAKGETQNETPSVKIKKSDWGQLPDGTKLDLYTLTNKNGMVIKITNYGGIITHWLAPDRNGLFEDICLGYDSIGGYIKSSPYFGALIGRYGNRIAKGKFSIDGKSYTLAQNNVGNSLHGGTKGFDKVIWAIEPLNTEGGLKLTYTSKDGEEGFPGNLTATVTYHLTDDNALKIKYMATTDKPTVVNLTQHAYFNLTGDGKRDILDHIVLLNADHYLPVDKTLIPTGELRPVKNTVFDFTGFEKIGKGINDTTDQQIKFGGGYDHCWVLNQPNDKTKLFQAAVAHDPVSGRLLEVLTTEPAIQFYTGNFLDGSITGKKGVVYKKRTGFCLETEHYPDAPNQPKFPTTLLRPNETYTTETVYRVNVKK